MAIGVMPEPIFEGVGVALVSLFDSDDHLLVSETAEHAASLVERGGAAIAVAGTTGELSPSPTRAGPGPGCDAPDDNHA
jgi:hypothetical protein